MSSKAQQIREEEIATGDSELTEGWTSAALFDLSRPTQWPTISTKALVSKGYPVFGANGQIGFYSKYNHKNPTILITCRGATCGTLNICVPHSYVTGNAMALDDLPEELCTLKFLFYALKARGFEDTISGSAQPQITRTSLESVTVPLAPRPEQQRIVAMLDRIIQQINVTEEKLKRGSSLVERFRQAVLAAACSGKLTQDWREQQNDSNTGEQLVHRILNLAPDSRESPQAMRQADAELPDGWCWTSLDTLIIDGPQNGLYRPSSEYGEGGTPIIRIEDFQNDSVRTRTQLSKLRVSRQEADKYAVHPNDLVINRVNSPSHIGKCLLVPPELCPAVFESNMMRITLSSELSPAWIATYIRSDGGRTRLTADAKWAVNQVSINQTDVVTTPIPIPSRMEQDEIVRRVDALFKLADAIEKRVAAASLRAENLTQAILAKAFRAELVPTEAELARREGREYEPAAVLLERIKTEKARTENPERTRASRRAASG